MKRKERLPLSFFFKKSFSAIKPTSSFPPTLLLPAAPLPVYQYFSCVIEKPSVLLRGKGSGWEVRDPSCTLNRSGMLHTLFLSNFRSKHMWSVCCPCMNQVQSLQLTQLLLLLTGKRFFWGRQGDEVRLNSGCWKGMKRTIWKPQILGWKITDIKQ